MAAFLKSFVSCLRNFFRRPSRINALESSSLGQLPVELILHITQFLDPVSAASFSLCCRPISLIIGTQYLKALQHEDRKSELYEFLTLLEQELPNQVLCYYCKKFHVIKNARRYTSTYNSTSFHLRRPSPACLIATMKSGACSHISQNFSWTVFQMAMKRYRQGRDYTGLLDLLPYHLTASFKPGHVLYQTTQLRIINGSLLARQQKIELPFRENGYWTVCPHNAGYHFSNYCRDRMVHWDEPEGREAELIQCEYCLTEFRLDFKAFEGEGVAMVLTTWQNLGRGLFPWDPEWRSHVYDPESKRMETLRERVHFERGSISDTFEEGKEFEFASHLTSSWRKEWLRRSYTRRFQVQ